MKGFFLLLVLANALLFAWFRWHDPHSASEGDALPEGVRELELLSDQQTMAERPPAATSRSSCRSIGPFRDAISAGQASAVLKEKGHTPLVRTAEGDVWAGLWVYLADLPSREDAEKTLAILHQNGISDAKIMPPGGSGIEISLGIYSESPRAHRRAERVRELGFEPKIAERTRKGQVYWLDVQPGPGPLELSDINQGTDGVGRILRLQVQPCGNTARIEPEISPGPA